MWYKDELAVEPSPRRLVESRGSRHALTVRDVQGADFGNYSCVADNSLGRAKKHMELSVNKQQTTPVLRPEDKRVLEMRVYTSMELVSETEMSKSHVLVTKGYNTGYRITCEHEDNFRRNDLHPDSQADNQFALKQTTSLCFHFHCAATLREIVPSHASALSGGASAAAALAASASGPGIPLHAAARRGRFAPSEQTRLEFDSGTARLAVSPKLSVSHIVRQSALLGVAPGRAAVPAGRPGPAEFLSAPFSPAADSYNLTWVVESYPPLEEVRLLYRRLLIVADKRNRKRKSESGIGELAEQNGGKRGGWRG
ncbi:limbic system-associated membrane protein-like [Gryllus bimaculatus]|nr:limbic system-associated membrane protein-like [Gryllus bimaculatus]